VGGKQVSEGKGEADDPLSHWHIREDFIGQQGGGLGHAAGTAAGAEPSFFTGERYQLLEVAFVAADPEKAMFEATAPQVGIKLSVNVLGQGFALLGQVVHQGREVRFDELVEQCLLRLMALAGGEAKCILAWRQHTDLTPASVVSKSRTMK
jgi:hypothetical protein